MAEKLKKEFQEEYFHLKTVLKDIPRFVDTHPEMNYIDFDYYTVHDLTLFSVEPDFNYASFKMTLDKITDCLPAIKRIFSKPIISLKDTSDVLPVEIVNKINQNTYSYLGNHLNDIDNFTDRGIKPRRLLTLFSEDDYSIYENRVFCDFIDEVLSYCRKNIRALMNLFYSSSTMEFNLLERVNHLDYFLALGKLHTGYIRDFNRYYGISKDLYAQGSGIIDALQARLNRPVYQRNLKRPSRSELKKSNIFLMQKDYHQVYLTYKYLLDNKLVQEKEDKTYDLSEMKVNYFYFIQILAIFSLGHFNFEIDPNEKMNLKELNSKFSFKNWKIRLENLGGDALLISVVKDTVYRIILVPSLSFNLEVNIDELKMKYPSDEYIVATPFEESYDKRKTVWLSIENVDSFRRLQQLFLKGMVYADRKFTDCPFCEDKLHYNAEEGLYECHSCRTTIKRTTCPDTDKPYYITGISMLKPKEVTKTLYNKEEEWVYSRKVESLLYYRNITKIDNKGNVICPICHKVHLKDEKDDKI